MTTRVCGTGSSAWTPCHAPAAEASNRGRRGTTGDMKWRRVARNPHLDDRRSMGGGGFPGGGLPIAGLGIPGVIIVVVLALLGGGNVLGGGGAGGIGVDAPLDQFPAAPQGDRTSVEPLGNQAEFINFVFTDVQKFWQGQFQKAGESYQPADIVLFRSATPTGCGQGTADTGPFYCPADSTVYIDLSFYQELSQRFGAPGDFAQAYVIAHEMGHHVQNLLGLNERAAGDRRAGANSASVALELQADCFAGVWGHEAAQAGRAQQRKVELDPGDV